MVELHDVHYEMELRGGGDIWRLKGRVVNHPDFPDYANISPSAPVEFDEVTNIMKTASGNTYKIISCVFISSH